MHLKIEVSYPQVHHVTLSACDGSGRPMWGTYGEHTIWEHGSHLQVRESIVPFGCFNNPDTEYVELWDMPHKQRKSA